MTDDYRQKILDAAFGLAVARSNLQSQQKELVNAKETLAIVAEWQDYVSTLQSEADAKQVAKMWELKLRALLVKAFTATGIKKFGDGLTIRERSGARLMDREQALSWVFKEARHLIKLDERELVAIAKRQDIPGVELFKTPKASIARDLSQYERKETGG